MALRHHGERPASRSHRVAAALVATLAAITLVGTIGAAPALAADTLRLAVATTYRVDAAKAAIHVTMDVSATNLKPNTATKYFYYDKLSFGIQAEARSVKATQGGRRLAVSTRSSDGYRQIEIKTPRLLFRQTNKTRITFDLPSGEPRSTSPIRVGRAHVAFTAWVWGDPGLADVRIVMPRQFTGDVQAWPEDTKDPLFSTSKDGQLTYAADDIDDPNRWYATIEASDRDALTDVPIGLTQEEVSIHAWPEDPEWLERVSAVLETGLPELEASIGLPWPVDDELGVTEVTSSELSGYAGLYDSADDEIEISEELDDHVIIHEAAHAWFNRDLFVQRWITEGLADEYASHIVSASGGTSVTGPDRVFPESLGHFRLNAWPPPSRIDEDTEATEDFGYDASWTVIHEIVNEVTEARMREVFKAAAARTTTYVGAGPAETSTFTVADWRRFLDLVEDVGGSTKAGDLIEDWVVTESEEPELVERAAARKRYTALLDGGEDWLPGILIRKPMTDWRFDEAEAAMAEAESVLAARDDLRAETAELGLAFPAGLEPVYETADSADDLDTLDVRIDTWLRAAAAVRSARDALLAERAPLVAVGLIGTTPDTAYAAALAAFAAGDDSAAVAGSSATLTVLAGAEAIGRERAIIVGAAVAVALLLLLLVVAIWLRRRRRARAMRVAALAAGAGFSVSSAFETNASEPDLVTASPGGLAAADSGPGGLAAAGSGSVVPAADDPGAVGPAATGSGAVGPATTDADAGAAGAATPDPYATLAATPDPVEGADVDGRDARGAEPD